ncbi:MAG: ABC transporter ATP-binding protein [Candidatus Gastranaerophilales bacterium]|nr:ABC transporter ATP-binding protein [Candidatus Gastranaerophilales bacterium]
MELLEIKNLNISFRVDEYILPAIFNVSFSLKKGESLALVGESGCGKSITAMSILNLLPPNAIVTQGDIMFEGQNILKMSDFLLRQIRGKKIAFIPQDPMTALNPLYTIGEQIKEVVELHQGLKGKEAQETVISALKSVKIPDAYEKYYSYPHQLSGGMRQRVIIAMALSCEPDLLIADEPTTALDVTVQAQILNLINLIQQERKTALILITHDLGVVYNVCENICVMYSGSIVEQTSTRELFANPLHPYTQALLNSLPTDKNTQIKAISGQPPSIKELITGCKFHPRCKHAMQMCEHHIPVLTEIEPNHCAACFLYNN